MVVALTPEKAHGYKRALYITKERIQDLSKNMKRHETNTLGITSGTIVKVLDLYNEFTKRKVMSSADTIEYIDNLTALYNDAKIILIGDGTRGFDDNNWPFLIVGVTTRHFDVHHCEIRRKFVPSVFVYIKFVSPFP